MYNNVSMQRLTYDEKTDMNLVSNMPVKDVVEIATAIGADYCSMLLMTGFCEDRMYLIRFCDAAAKLRGRQMFYEFFANYGTMVS